MSDLLAQLQATLLHGSGGRCLETPTFRMTTDCSWKTLRWALTAGVPPVSAYRSHEWCRHVTLPNDRFFIVQYVEDRARWCLGFPGVFQPKNCFHDQRVELVQVPEWVFPYEHIEP